MLVPSLPSVNIPQAISSKLARLILIVLIVALILGINIFIYQKASQRGRLDGWRKIAKERNIPFGNYVVAYLLQYRLEGYISKMEGDKITIKSGNKEQEFQIAATSFVTTSPLTYFEDWPTKIISESPINNFNQGDQVIAIVNVYQLGNTFPLKYLIKVENTKEQSQL